MLRLGRSARIKFKEYDLAVANQRLAEATVGEQAAIQRVVGQVPQVIPLYEADIAKGVKISITDKKSLEFVVKI
jgi:hypothetical protein